MRGSVKGLVKPVLQLTCKGVEHLLIDRQTQETAFFFSFDQTRFGQNFDMVRDGGLGEWANFLDFVADQILALANAAQNMQAPLVRQGFGDFFDLILVEGHHGF